MAKSSDKDFQEKWLKIVKKAAVDEVFKQRLLQNPAQVLKEYDLEVPSGVTLKVVENTAKVQYMVLPELKATKSLSDEELKKAAGGSGCKEPAPRSRILGGMYT